MATIIPAARPLKIQRGGRPNLNLQESESLHGPFAAITFPP